MNDTQRDGQATQVPLMPYEGLDRFLAVSERGTRPVVVTGGLTDWKAATTWTSQYLRARYGKHTVYVSTSRDGVFRGDPDKGFSHVVKPMSLGSFLDSIAPDATRTERCYLTQLPLAGPFAGLLADLTMPRYVISASPVRPHLWLGPAGNVSALHYDGAQNLLAQVLGRKRVSLFPPEQTGCLYPYPAGSKIPHMSQVDIDNPDFDTFPKFKDAVRTEVILQEGEMLYIPVRWWHQVVSLDTSISVNFWWTPAPT